MITFIKGYYIGEWGGAPCSGKRSRHGLVFFVQFFRILNGDEMAKSLLNQGRHMDVEESVENP